MRKLDIIGMLHIPINTILAAPAQWRDGLQLPAPTEADWRLVDVINVGNLTWDEELALLRQTSFYPFLETTMLVEANTYGRNGINGLMLENVAAPYFVRNENPRIIPAVMNALAHKLRSCFPNNRLGIQVLAFGDNLAMQIAIQHQFQFIRAESVLFAGTRPEGQTPNEGNLARLYMGRNRVCSALGRNAAEPKVYVDMQKKHTAFPAELDDLDLWLENTMFMKLEGVIITGHATGSAVAEGDLAKARKVIDAVPWDIPLIVGSGVSAGTLKLCAMYADMLIVGSSLKEGGYWENPLNEDRVRRFMSHLPALLG